MISINTENGTVTPFTVILSNRGHTHLGEILNISGMRFTDYLNSAKELYFQVSKYADGIKERLWDDITDLRLVYVKEINTYFEINVSLADGDYNTKSVTGKSVCECELSQKMLYNFEVNTETDILRDGYEPTQFYNPNNPKASLLHRVLSETPAYKINHVDVSLMTMQRSFSANDKSIYDFLTDDCATEFNCIFLFDSVDRSISVYDLYTVCNDCGHRGAFSDICPECNGHNLKYFGNDTTIFVSSDNLTEEITFETDIDNVKNCFVLEAGDDVMTAAVMSYIPTGGKKIFYVSPEQQGDMPSALAERIQSYNLLYDSKVDDYHQLMEHIYDCIEKITYYTSKQMPEITIPDTTATTEAAKLTSSNLSPLALSSLTSYTSLATVNSALINYAKTYVRSGFVKLEVDSGAFQLNGQSNGVNTGIWTGRLKVTSYSDKEDIAYTSNLRITVNDDYQTFMHEKILKNIADNNTDDNSVYNVLCMKDLNSFKDALKLYSLNRLISFRDAVNGVLSVLLEANGGNTASELYTPFYSPYYDKLVACNAEIAVRKKEIENWEKQQEKYELQKNEMQKSLDFKSYLGENFYNLFTTYIRENKYTNSNYISDGLSDDKIFERAQEFLETARKELIKSSHYQHSLRADMYNLLLMEEFSPIIDSFQLGNWIRVEADEDIYRLRLISYEIDFDNLNTLHTEFSDVTKTADGINDIQSILRQANSMASTYSYVSRQATNGADADMTIEKFRAEGLDSALYLIKNADSEEITFGKNGLLARSYDDISDTYSDKQLIVTHNILAYTIDNWRSVKCALGEMKLTIDGKTTWEYGLNSDFCISSKIIAGNIYSANYSSVNKKGSRINLDDGTFTFADEKLVFDGSSLRLKGCTIDWSSCNESENMWARIEANTNGITMEAQRASDAEGVLSGRVDITAEAITSEVKRASEAEGELSSRVTQTAKEIRAELKDEANGLSNTISATAGSIISTVSQTYETKTDASQQYSSLNSYIEQMANSIRLEVSATYETQTDSGNKYEFLQSYIQQTADKIELKVSKGDLSSEISQEAGKISISANRLSIQSTYTSLTETGELTTTAGYIGGFQITNNSFGTNEDVISIHRSGDWALRVGPFSNLDGIAADQFNFCVGHEGSVYCNNKLTVRTMLSILCPVYNSSGNVVDLSDRNRKNSIEKLNPEESAAFIYSLTPSKYKYNNGTSGRYHHGLIAQDVKKAMGDKDWGLYVEFNDDESKEHLCGLRYGELISDLIATVQTLNNRLIEIEKKEKLTV